jgi:hypothetical protein
MAPQQPLVIIDPLAWEHSTATPLALGQLVTGGQLAANEDGQPAEWIVPSERERAPNPPYGYIVSFIRFHERGFTAPASRFMRALCYHYGVELPNFAPNAISQAAMFVGVCEGFLGIPVNWDLWVHLFHAELHTLPTSEPRTCRATHAGGMSLAVRTQRKDDYIPSMMMTNNADWERGWFYLRKAEPVLPPYTGKVLRERPPSWYHGVSPPQHQARLDSLVVALKELAGRGLTAGVVLANLHHRRVVPLMERPLRIYEMTEIADPVTLAKSRLLPTPFPRAFAATRARRAIDPKSGRCDDKTLGGHVSGRMRRALRLGVQKALGVVRSHYEVNFEAVAEGYVVPEGVEDEAAMEHVDALATDAAEALTEAFEEFLFPDAADADAPQA